MVNEKQTTEGPRTIANPWAGLKLFRPIISLALLANAVAVGILFYYLKKIGWVELLQASITSEKGLALVLIFLVVTIGVIALIFYSGSYYLFLATTLFNDPKDIPKNVAAYILVMHALWLAIFSLVVFGKMMKREADLPVCEIIPVWLAEHFAWAVGGFLVLSIVLSVLIHWLQIRNASIKRNFVKNTIFGFLVAFSSLMSTLIIDTAIKLQGSGLTDDTPWEIVFPMLALTLPGIYIGVTILKSYQKTGDINRGLSAAGIVAIVFFITLFFALPRYTALPVSMATLRAVSVYSTELTTFQLIDVKQRGVYEKVGLKFSEESDQAAYFEGYVRYRFADVLLLCSTAYDPLVDVTKDESEKSQLQYGCIQARADEVRRVQQS